MLKETGARIGEAYNVEWKDIDFEHKTVTFNHPEKGSLPRILHISDKLKGMLNNIPKDTNAPFSRTSKKKGLRVTFTQMRNKTAKKINNPRLKQIHFHTFRHWKATTDYYKLRDSTIIRHTLGHKSAVMTDRYIHIVETLYNNDAGEWTSKAVKTKEEAMQLINEGYTKADEIDGYHIYRKRK
jgi:integrase